MDLIPSRGEPRHLKKRNSVLFYTKAGRHSCRSCPHVTNGALGAGPSAIPSNSATTLPEAVSAALERTSPLVLFHR